MDRKKVEAFASIPQKANQTLSLVFIGLLIICARIWHLAVVQHDNRTETATKARKRLVVEPAMRGTIRDRFHITLACNAIEYRVGVVWPPIQEIPRRIIENGQKRLLRKEYVTALGAILAGEINVDPIRIEDVIYSHAAFSQNTPVIIKTGLTEQQYYRLNALSKDWPGLVVERAPKRIYPRNRSGCHVIGYTAPLNRQEFDRALAEIRDLKGYVEGVEQGEDREIPPGFSSYFSAKERLIALERRAYNLNDEIGKMGIEASFENQLRGMVGKKYFFTNVFGETVREASGSREATPGKRLVLSISSELQTWCEQLLAMSEVDRYNRLEQNEERIAHGAKNPYLRGGAIVAIDPKTAEVVACASYPRFDPNDFVRSVPALCGNQTCEQTSKWLEDPIYTQKIWDLEWPIIREEADEKVLHEKELWLTWDRFLHMVLPVESSFAKILPGSATIREVVRIQEEQQCSPICIDLSRLIVRKEELSEAVLKTIGALSIDNLRTVISAKVAFSNSLKRELRNTFQKGPFQKWRTEYERTFLAEKRAEEAAKGIHPRPYLHYLDKECTHQFSEWWLLHGNSTLLSALSEQGEPLPEWIRKATHQCFSSWNHTGQIHELRKGLLGLSSLVKALPSQEGVILLSSLKGFEDLTFPLTGTYTSNIRNTAPKIGQELIRSLFSLTSPPLASFCHMQPSAQGSIFKLVVAYAALHQRLQQLHGNERVLNPDFFHIVDQTFKSSGRFFVGYDSSGKPIPQLYKGGRLPRSSESTIGTIDLIHAIGRSSNPYFALLAGDFLESPLALSQAAQQFGYGEKTGIALPFESPGRFPKDLQTNKTGVYTTAIGQHTLSVTPMQTAVMLSTLACDGNVIVPKIVRMVIGGEDKTGLSEQTPSTHAPALKAIGIDTPIWLNAPSETAKQQIHITPKKIKRHLDLAKKERSIIFEGMLASFEHAIQDQHLKRFFSHRPTLLNALCTVQSEVIGKSSTAESNERLGLGIGQKPTLYNHTWFGGIFFPKGTRAAPPFDTKEPELIVVVFLRYGTFGKDAAPIAASVAHEWREIRKRHGELN